MKDHHRMRSWSKGQEQYFYLDEGGKFVGDNPIFDDENPLRVDLSTVMYSSSVIELCTGLRDKNGTLIYEGDRLKSKFPEEKEQRTYVVKYSDSNGCWLAVLEEFPDQWIYGGDFKDCLVIGNTHKNQELLN